MSGFGLGGRDGFALTGPEVLTMKSLLSIKMGLPPFGAKNEIFVSLLSPFIAKQQYIKVDGEARVQSRR